METILRESRRIQENQNLSNKIFLSPSRPGITVRTIGRQHIKADRQHRQTGNTGRQATQADRQRHIQSKAGNTGKQDKQADTRHAGNRQTCSRQ
jgi:hypothetical protein